MRSPFLEYSTLWVTVIAGTLAFLLLRHHQRALHTQDTGSHMCHCPSFYRAGHQTQGLWNAQLVTLPTEPHPWLTRMS